MEMPHSAYLCILTFLGCSATVGHYDNLPCAAPFKDLQDLVVSFLFF